MTKKEIDNFQQWLHHHELRYEDMLAWYDLRAIEFAVGEHCTFYNFAFQDGYLGINRFHASDPWVGVGPQDYQRWHDAGTFAKHLKRELCH